MDQMDYDCLTYDELSDDEIEYWTYRGKRPFESMLLNARQRTIAEGLVNYHRRNNPKSSLVLPNSQNNIDAIFRTTRPEEVEKLINERLVNPRSRPITATDAYLQAILPKYDSLDCKSILEIIKEDPDSIFLLRHFPIDTSPLNNVREGSRDERSYYAEKLTAPAMGAVAAFKGIRDGVISRLVRNTVVAGAGAAAVYPQIRRLTNPELNTLNDTATELNERVIELTEKLDKAGLTDEAAKLREEVSSLISELEADPNIVEEGASALSDGLSALSDNAAEFEEIASALVAQAGNLLAEVNAIMQGSLVSTVGVVAATVVPVAIASLISGYFDLSRGIKNLRAKNPFMFAVKLRVRSDQHSKDNSSPWNRLKANVNDWTLKR